MSKPKDKLLTFTLEEVEPMLDDMGGFCRACGAEHYNIEPDARKYTCESCGEKQVYGAQERLLRGWAS